MTQRPTGGDSMVFHATNITFTGGPFAKIIENHAGKRYARIVRPFQVVQVPQTPATPAKPKRRWWPFGKPPQPPTG